MRARLARDRVMNVVRGTHAYVLIVPANLQRCKNRIPFETNTTEVIGQKHFQLMESTTAI